MKKSDGELKQEPLKKEHVLFVCTYNKMRSITGEELYKKDPRFRVKSAGVDEDATVEVSSKLIDWADIIVVMEEMHVQWFRHYHPGVLETQKLICLDIPDAFYVMEPELVELLRNRFEERYAGLKEGNKDRA